MPEDFLEKEYFTLTDIVKDADQRLLTIKGWGVTLSLVSLGLGFQTTHYGLFLVAAVSAFTFWFVEASTKKHQMRHYVRLREIEVRRYEKISNEEKEGDIPTPLINWSWENAHKYLKAENSKEQQGEQQENQPSALRPPTRYKPFKFLGQEKFLGISAFDINMFTYPHVFLPHLITAGVGGFLFIWAQTGHFPKGYLL